VEALLHKAFDRFRDTYGRAAEFAAVAPGRVNLIGDHTDYAGGLALPCAIDLYTVAVAAAREPGAATRVLSDASATALELPAAPDAQRVGDWGDYLRGVRWGFARAGIAHPALDVLLLSNVPLGAGLSSSAALELAFASLLETAAGQQLAPHDRALLCQRAERDFAGVPCGILDQFAITFAEAAHAMLLDCRAQEVTQTALPDSAALLLIDSRVSHDLADGEYAKRRAQVEAAERALPSALRDCSAADAESLEDPLLRARARHVTTENERVKRFAAALAAGDREHAGQLMLESHRSLAEDFAVSCAELDWLVATAMEAGAFGARMTGGGFGGSVICLCAPEQIAAIRARVDSDYPSVFGRDAELREVRPVAGAHGMRVEH
jgi:galactokinase